MVTYSTAQGYKPDYLYLMQRMMMDNPEAAVRPFPSCHCPCARQYPMHVASHRQAQAHPCAGMPAEHQVISPPPRAPGEPGEDGCEAARAADRDQHDDGLVPAAERRA